MDFKHWTEGNITELRLEASRMPRVRRSKVDEQILHEVILRAAYIEMRKSATDVVDAKTPLEQRRAIRVLRRMLYGPGTKGPGGFVA